MDRDQCWSMIETARQASGGDVQQQAALVKAALRRLLLTEVIGFQRKFGFRGWLIGQGQRTYEAALADPDSLADLPELHAGEGMLPWGEVMWFVASEVHQERTGGELPPEACWTTELVGSWWPYDQHQEQLLRRYPRLWARFRSNTP
jgi:hypothetical protein